MLCFTSMFCVCVVVYDAVLMLTLDMEDTELVWLLFTDVGYDMKDVGKSFEDLQVSRPPPTCVGNVRLLTL